MPNYAKYQWKTKMGTVKHGGAVAGVTLDTSLLDEMTSTIQDHLSGLLKEFGDDAAKKVSDLAPVDTGELAESYIKNSMMIEKLTYRIEDGVSYGIFQELGTSKMSAQPHVVPVVEASEPELVEAFRIMFL
jgi:HK97 gp10 family phage protein